MTLIFALKTLQPDYIRQLLIKNYIINNTPSLVTGVSTAKGITILLRVKKSFITNEGS
jgi:hypothetical protein